MQLTPKYAKLMALQTCAIEVDVLVVQMTEVQAHRSELQEKVLEIEEKGDNHIPYLEAKLKELSLVEEEKKADEDSKGKAAKVWKDLGPTSPQLTMPPLTPVVPSTN